MPKITRIAYNSADWRRPTGEAKSAESGKTYNRLHGFGHEDWLFRSEWLIDGWRYAFIQGVNKSHDKLIRTAEPIDLTLFTRQPDKSTRYVATIRAVECLHNQQAADALVQFKNLGWFATMQQEVIAVSGDPSALGAAKWAKHILNVRFRLENVRMFPPNTYATAGDPILKVTRYGLYDEANIGQSKARARLTNRPGSAQPPTTTAYVRSATPAVECTPEHAHMQAKLMQDLRLEYPTAQIMREKDFVDITVRTQTELLLFEIKSDLEPRSVIRRALGQIMEYAFHPSRKHSPSPQLIIVGRRPLSGQDAAYLARLRIDFNLPISYRVVHNYLSHTPHEAHQEHR